MNFEDEDETNEIIAHLHTHDWQTNGLQEICLLSIQTKQVSIKQQSVLHFQVIIQTTNGGMGYIVLKKPVILTRK